MRHTSGQPAEHVRNGDSHPADARSPATFTWFKSDDVLVLFTPYFTTDSESAEDSQVEVATATNNPDALLV